MANPDALANVEHGLAVGRQGPLINNDFHGRLGLNPGPVVQAS